MRTIKIALALIMILNLFAPALCFSQMQLLEQPQNLDEAKQIGQKALEVGQKEIPGIIERTWQNEVLPVWQKMFDWVKTHLWGNWLKNWLQNIWNTALRILKIEVEQRTPAVKEDFQKEKQQIKEEAPQVGKSFWEKFKELIK